MNYAPRMNCGLRRFMGTPPPPLTAPKPPPSPRYFNGAFSRLRAVPSIENRGRGKGVWGLARLAAPEGWVTPKNERGLSNDWFTLRRGAVTAPASNGYVESLFSARFYNGQFVDQLYRCLCSTYQTAGASPCPTVLRIIFVQTVRSGESPAPHNPPYPFPPQFEEFSRGRRAAPRQSRGRGKGVTGVPRCELVRIGGSRFGGCGAFTRRGGVGTPQGR